MGLFAAVGLTKSGLSIDWDLTPFDTFGTFESWGGRERVRNRSERFYYFYIDGWRTPPKVCLMERGIKHARVLAVVDAPQHLVDNCIKEQGGIISLDRSYAINGTLRRWLSENLLNSFSSHLLTPLMDEREDAVPASDLFQEETGGKSACITLPTVLGPLTDEQISPVVKSSNFFDAAINGDGRFINHFIDNGDGLTATDTRTGLMWQRAGSADIITNRQAAAYCRKKNEEGFAGYSDWRLPSLTEGLSLLEPQKNRWGLHLHPCFDDSQPFIFLVHRRKPGGQWYIDFNAGTVFWASGHNPGGFARLCRTR